MQKRSAEARWGKFTKKQRSEMMRDLRLKGLAAKEGSGVKKLKKNAR